MERITQIQIINTLKFGWNAYKDPTVWRIVESLFHAENNSQNYTAQFKAAQQEWTDKNWRVVAKDVQNSFLHYKSR